MALIYCPECKKEVSDLAEACPHCGFVINKTQKTSLEEKETNPILGIFLIFCGVMAALSVIILGPLGILSIIGGVALMGVGSTQFTGNQKGTCPYCKTTVKVPSKASTFKCPHCNKVSSKSTDFLSTID